MSESPWAEGARVELADFAPDGHHHTCDPQECDTSCASLLYTLAQTQEQRIEALCSRWDALTKGESPTTHQIRAALYGTTP